MPSALIRQTVPQPEPADDPVEASGESTGPGNGESATDPKPRTRRPRAKPAGDEKSRGRKLTIRDTVFARLELQAIKSGTTASAIADKILDRELPHHRIVTDG
jgi:hypothetical protein